MRMGENGNENRNQNRNQNESDNDNENVICFARPAIVLGFCLKFDK